MSPSWISACIDLPVGDYERGRRFWAGVTGWSTTAADTALHPSAGDPHLRFRQVDAGPAGVTVDLHDPGGRATPLGRPRAARWPGGDYSVVDQVCLDIPPSRFDAECELWVARTGWELITFPEHPEFLALARPAELPIRILLQRLDEEQPYSAAHLDVAATDRAAETHRHLALGAEVVREQQWWTVLRDPVGLDYCIVDREEVGMLT